MPRGKPDYHRSTVIEAKHGTDFIPVIVDTAGQMYIALTGQQIAVNNLKTDYFKEGENIGAISANVTVDQTDSDRLMVGKEGQNLHYIALDTNGVIIARLKAASGEVLKDIAIDTSGILLARMQGKTDNGLKDVAVDSSGIMLARMQGDSTEGLKDVYVDTAGKMVARVQGVGAGLEPLFTVDDGGDEDVISDWVEGADGLDPVSLEGFGKEGQHSMKLGIDADKHGADYGLWIKSTSIGDMFQYKDMKLYIWIYFNTIDYLQVATYGLYYEIGSDSSNVIYFYILKSNLIQGWNLIELDLANPTGTSGTIDWTVIAHQKILFYGVVNNQNDFYGVIDLIAVVKPNPQTGSLIDVATDKDGLMLSKMVGSYGELHKPITTDRFGHLRVNISEQGEFTQVSNPYRSGLQNDYSPLIDVSIDTHTLLEIEGRGTVMGGTCRHGGSVSHNDCKIVVTVDGVDFGIYSFQYLNVYNAITPWSHIPHLIMYDDTAHHYVVSFPSSLIFYKSIKIELQEVTSATNYTYLYFIYALF